ncbi:hypothetical protein GCM10010193_44980 [Kitasatospora atroaurantiaca]|uniref:Ricin-type beta-trefoil lectin protein n=1 Tax=Kitasatospora atroaurantiaca TaxID=285545 RepID=A0A561EZT5_9ACTN|nr:RICIN domain-containing protein [Kitasatospora atroaurantiaca]TWE21120.1 ricin-type beta-trefoil lectin protein [Kitasatospora atroaurantiaca]
MAGRRAAHRRRNHRGLLITVAAVTAGVIASAVGIGAVGDGRPTAAAGVTALSATAASPAAAPRHDEAPTPIREIPKSDPARGLVYTGLVPAAKDDKCSGVFKVSTADLCTHGPDVPPKGVDIHKTTQPAVAAVDKDPELPGADGSEPPSSADLLKDQPPVLDAPTGTTVAAASPAGASPSASGGNTAAAAAGTTVVCDGDGTTGNRVQVLYVHAPGQDRFGQYLPSFKKWAADADAIYNASAGETGGVRHIRFVTQPDCTASVLDVELSAGAIREFGAGNSALASQGFNRRDRKYMIFADAQVYCGIGTFNGDERPGQDNLSNFGPSYGRTDNGCWGGSTAAHELGHNLGAVNNSAPNSSKAGHCVDEWDIMCYSDAPYYPQMQIHCADRSHDDRLDCNHDDYYSTNVKPGSYLATHWNVANNQFLIPRGGSNPDPNPSPTPTPTSSPTPSPSPTSTTGPDVTVGQLTADSVVLSWQQVNGAAEYEIRLNGRAIGSVKSTVVRVVRLQADTAYTVAIAVRDANGRTSKPGRQASFRTLKSGGPVGPTKPGTPYQMLNGLTGQAADLWGSSTNDGTVLIAYQSTGYANQRWIFDDAGDGYLRIKSALTGKCLQLGGRLVQGQYVAQQPCSGDASQQWKVTAGGSGYTLAAKGSSLVLGVSHRWYYGGWLLELQRPDGQAYQNWSLQQAS